MKLDPNSLENLKKTSTFDCCSGQAVGEEGWPAEADSVQLWLQSSYLIAFPWGDDYEK